MNPILSFNAFPLLRRFPLRFLSMLAMCGTACFCQGASEARCLYVSLDNGTIHQIPLNGEIIMTPVNGNLDIQSTEGFHQLPLLHIRKFYLSSYVSEGATPSIGADNSNEWTIVTTNGMVVRSGNGTPDFSSLDKGEVYIVRQGTLTYTFIVR